MVLQNKRHLSKNSPDTLNIDLKLQNNDFLISTCTQINKNLQGLTDQKIKITDQIFQSPLSKISQQLCEIVHLLEKMNKIQQFIYTVDIKETVFKAYLTRKISIDELNYEIIKREAQKVYLRHYFSNQ